MNEGSSNREIVLAAYKAFEKEQFDAAVAAYAAVLREECVSRRWWHRFFPWQITIKRRDA